MNEKTKLGAVVLFALLSASAHASDWFSVWFDLELSDEPVMTTMGAGGGGGHPPGPVDPN